MTFFNNATASKFLGISRVWFSHCIKGKYADGSPIVPAGTVGQHKIWHVTQLVALRDGTPPPANVPTVLGIEQACGLAAQNGLTEGQFRYLVEAGEVPVHTVGNPPKLIWIFTPAMVTAGIRRAKETKWIKPGGRRLVKRPPIDQFIYPTDEDDVWDVIGLGKTRRIKGINDARERARLLARGSILETIGDESIMRRRADVTRRRHEAKGEAG